MWILYLALPILLVVTTIIIATLPQWGKSPSGTRKQKIVQSPQF